MSSIIIGIDAVKNSIRNVPNFPKEGIQFKDVSTAFKDQQIFKYIVTELRNKYIACGITKVVGIESRGFILGSILAGELEAGFVPIRKPGKLPSETFVQSYDLEYGSDSLEIHTDALDGDDVVLIHDDLLATGGTVNAAVDLVRKFGVTKIYVNFFVELDFLCGRERIAKDINVWSLIHY
ncbi:MAG: adenine phosphoribosyltransferase [Prolixibacteraceae bacterium]|jgi:adenine phosphoribosyltransferase|nr:adenine phosphoribosyltransferase [Prolixibacteraceae bacterium]